MQKQKKHSNENFPRMMLYPQVSRVHNAGVHGGVTVNDITTDGNVQLSTRLISGIPVSKGSLVVQSQDEFIMYRSAGDGYNIDGVDPLEVEEFVGQDHYDCARFAHGGFGAVQDQLDCA